MMRTYSKVDIDGYHYELHCNVSNRGQSLLHLVASVSGDKIFSLDVSSYEIYGIGHLNTMEIISFVNRCYRIVSGQIGIDDASVLEFD